MSTKKTDLELLQILKEEINRLGLEDSPSRTVMQKLYDKNKMPHPNTYVNRFGSWQEALRFIGIDYDGRKASGKAAKKANTGKSYATKWSSMSKEDIIKSTLDEVHEKNIIGAKDYQDRRDKKKSPSLPTVTALTGLVWHDISKLYNERYSNENSSPVDISKNKWVDMSDEELMYIIAQEMKRIGSDRHVDYVEKRDKEKTPSFATLANRGISWNDVKKMKNNERKSRND